MKQSAIGWTDYSGGDLNFVTGCTPVSEGCENCYARAIYERFGRDHSKVVWDTKKRQRAMRAEYGWPSPKRGCGNPMAFVCDTGDLFHEDVPDGFILDTLDHMGAWSVDWQVLTKRPERMQRMIEKWCSYARAPLPSNIWLGVTAENQARADERIPILLDIPAAVRFVSVEPMLGPVVLDENWIDENAWGPHAHPKDCWAFYDHCWCRLDWVICGAESGPKRRPFEVAWAESLYQQCKRAGAAYFGKQDSGLRPGTPLVLSDGIVHEWPEA